MSDYTWPVTRTPDGRLQIRPGDDPGSGTITVELPDDAKEADTMNEAIDGWRIRVWDYHGHVHPITLGKCSRSHAETVCKGVNDEIERRRRG